MATVGGREVLKTMAELVDPQHAALLVVDVQKDFAYVGGYLDRQGGDYRLMAAALANIAAAIDAARRAGALVIYIQQTVPPNHQLHSGAWIRHFTKGLKNSPDNYGCVEHTWGWEFCDEVLPRPGEIIVPKLRASAFVGTPLALILRLHGVRTVVVCGLATETCVASTVRDALWHDFYSVALLDCVQSSDQECHEIWTRFFERGDCIRLAELTQLWTQRE